MLEALGQRLQYKVVNITDVVVDINAVEMIPRPLAEKYSILAYKNEDGVLYILMDDPLNFYGIEDVRQVAGTDLHIELCEKQRLIMLSSTITRKFLRERLQIRLQSPVLLKKMR